MSLKTLAAAGFLFVAAPAWAGESLVGGQALEYNHAYPCKGERIIVAHCRDEDDSSYCQVVYPDRPFVNGNQVAPIEKRGDIVAKLNACSNVASAPTSPAAPAAKGSSTSEAGSYAKTGKPPGVGDAHWLMLGYNEEEATYFTKAQIKRTAGTGEGWFTLVYPKPQEMAGMPGVQFLQTRLRADCVKGTFTVREGAYFGDDGKLLGGALIDEPEVNRPAPGSAGEEQLRILCDKPQELVSDKPIDSDGLGLLFIYTGFLQQDSKN
jgi:hypothetical protein